MSEIPQAWVEKAAQAIYPDVMGTWEDQWPLWEYADDQQAEFMRDLARAVLAAVLPDVRHAVLLKYADEVETAWHDEMVPEHVTQMQVADYLRKMAAREAGGSDG